jgi:hypothetical protein
VASLDTASLHQARYPIDGTRQTSLLQVTHLPLTFKDNKQAQIIQAGLMALRQLVENKRNKVVPLAQSGELQLHPHQADSHDERLQWCQAPLVRRISARDVEEAGSGPRDGHAWENLRMPAVREYRLRPLVDGLKPIADLTEQAWRTKTEQVDGGLPRKYSD